jgi:death-on-curing protein
MKSLDVDRLTQIHDFVVQRTGGLLGLKDIGRLESVVASQFQNVFGLELYPTLLHKAASIMRGIICDHPFLDGNKRTGILSAIIFLEMNGIIFATEDSQIEDFAVEVATKKLNIESIVDWLKQNTVSI